MDKTALEINDHVALPAPKISARENEEYLLSHIHNSNSLGHAPEKPTEIGHRVSDIAHFEHGAFSLRQKLRHRIKRKPRSMIGKILGPNGIPHTRAPYFVLVLMEALEFDQLHTLGYHELENGSIRVLILLDRQKP